jgi:hypothetical protein
LSTWIAHFTGKQTPQTGTALPAAAAVGYQDIGSVRAEQNRLAGATFELLAARLDGNLVASFGNGVK